VLSTARSDSLGQTSSEQDVNVSTVGISAAKLVFSIVGQHLVNQQLRVPCI
jgi:hypothetical protein